MVSTERLLRTMGKMLENVTQTTQMSSSFDIAVLSFNSRTYNNAKGHDFMVSTVINFLSEHPNHASLNFGKMAHNFFFIFVIFF